MRGAAAVLASVMFALASCATRPATQVMVFVDAEPGVRASTTMLEVMVEGSSGRAPADFALRELSTVSPIWPVRVALVPLDGETQRVYRVTVRAIGASAETPTVAEARVISGYRIGETIRIDLLLQDACVAHAPCSATETCVDGVCVDATVDPNGLPTLGADAGALDSGRSETGVDGGAHDAGPDDAPDAVVPDAPDMGVDAGLPPGEEALLTTAGANAHFGYAVAMSADGLRVLIGVPDDVTTGGVGAGSVRVFRREGTTWVAEATLLAAGGAAGDGFGWSVALSADGSRALVGVPLDDTPSGVDTGSARVFRRLGTTWAEEATLRSLRSGYPNRFGYSVALAGDATRAIVGEESDDVPAACPSGCNDKGSATVFVRTGEAWSLEQTLLASDGVEGDHLGASVAMTGDGTRALVGAWGRAGSARVFVRTGAVWTEEALLVASDAQIDDRFGVSVAITADGSTALVGADRDDTAAGANAGSARVFVRTGSAWTETASLAAADDAAGDQFGYSVAISGDGTRALVGSVLDDTDDGLDAGSVGLFVLGAGAEWSEAARLFSSSGAPEDWFGAAVAMDAIGSRAAVGASLAGDDDTGTVTMLWLL